MGLHITRWFTAMLNLLLGSGLIYVWFMVVHEGGSPSSTPGMWVFLTALTLLTLTATAAAATLLRRGTLRQGLRWNFAVALSWFATSLSGIAPSLEDGRFNNGDVEAILVLGGGGVLWLFLGWCIARFLRIESERTLAAATTTPIVTDNHATTLPYAAPLIMSAPAQPQEQTEPLVLGRR